MKRLDPRKLHTNFFSGADPEAPIIPRRYTLTHSDTTGELFLSIGSDYSRKQISGLYTRVMRDEVLAEWKIERDKPLLHAYCHVSGGLTFGGAGWRYTIFRQELPLVLEAIRYGDQIFFQHNPELDNATIFVHFEATQPLYQKTEDWGKPSDYR